MKVYWKDADKTILIRQFSQNWTLEEYDAAVLEMRQMLVEVQHSVFLIVDAREIGSIPGGALNHISEANRNLPSHVVMRIMVSESKLLMGLYAILQRVAPDNFKNFYWVSTMEAAYEKIEQYQKI